MIGLFYQYFFAAVDVDAFLGRLAGVAAIQVVIAVVVVCVLLHVLDGCNTGAIGVYNLQILGCGCLLFPAEAATGGQERLFTRGANEYAFQDFYILLGGNAIEPVFLPFVPTAAERHTIALSVVHAYSVDFGVDEAGISIPGFQILVGGREDEVRHAGLNALGGAIDKEELQCRAFLTDSFQAFYADVLGCGCQLFGIQRHGQAEGVVTRIEIAVHLYRGLCVLNLFHLQRLRLGVEGFHSFLGCGRLYVEQCCGHHG